MQKWFSCFIGAAALAPVFLLGTSSRWQNSFEISDPQLTLDQGIIRPLHDGDTPGVILSIGAKP
jgi:hypothetical protein